MLYASCMMCARYLVCCLCCCCCYDSLLYNKLVCELGVANVDVVLKGRFDNDFMYIQVNADLERLEKLAEEIKLQVPGLVHVHSTRSRSAAWLRCTRHSLLMLCCFAAHLLCVFCRMVRITSLTAR